MKDPNVDEFIQSADKWQAEMAYLRFLLLDCLMVETYKWRTPVYMVGKKNLIAISSLKAVSYTHLTLPTKRIV